MSEAEDQEIVREAQERFNQCVDWESYARANAEIDTRFANGDSINNFQWQDDIQTARVQGNRPCLTINKTQVHNNLIINDAKQNKAAINVRPIGDGATYQAAQVYNDVIRHIEYRSNAESVYDSAITTQVQSGVGYWRIKTDYESATSFNQEIYIVRIPDPKSVYIDCDAVEADKSDARYAFVYEDMPNDLFKATYPDEDVGTQAPLNGAHYANWINGKHTRVAEYFRKTQKKDKLIEFVHKKAGTIRSRYSDLTDEGKRAYKNAKDEEKQERDILTDNIMWYKIAGSKIIDRKPWPGSIIPIICIVGTEVVIDGRMDRFGNTRALQDPQRMYNYNASNYVEMVALQPRSPFIGPVQAFENLEEYWKTANTTNHAFLPFNHIGDDGMPIPAPERSQPPQLVPAYIQGMDIAEKQMMMATGQYQAQMGENENAKSGVAINARQRQGDRSTYHYIDNQALGIRLTGKILIDLIPKIYDTERVMRIRGLDGSHSEVMIDPNAPQATQKQPPQPGQDDGGMKVAAIIFNPSVGTYDVVSDVGPDYATRRQESSNAMMQILSSDKNFMNVAGDLFFKMMDFPLADQLAQRYEKIVPPNLTGDAPDPKLEAAMHQASDKILQQQQQIADLIKKLNDKDRDTDIKAYEAETKRKTGEADVLKQIDNARTSLDPDELKRLVHESLIQLMSPDQVPPDTNQQLQGLPGMDGSQPPAPQGQPQPQPPVGTPEPGIDHTGKPGVFIRNHFGPGKHAQVMM